MTDLERELVELGADVDYPPTPDLAPRVRARLEERGARRFFPARRTLALAFAVLLVAGGALLAVPSTRSAILEWLGITGVEIERVETLPTVPRGARPDLGERVTLAEAEKRAPYELRVPARFDEVYFREPPVGGQVSFSWRSDGRALVLSEFEGQALPFAQKFVGPRTRLERVRVNGAHGLWISGAPHVFRYADRAGNFREEARRLAGNVLLWEERGLTFRLEGARTKAVALAIAASVR